MEDPNSAIFSYAKLEYTNQLIDTLSPHVFDGVKSIYDEAKKTYSKDQSKTILSFFRIFLEKVPSWSNEIIETETDRIIEVSCCDWLDDLITAVFISHTKILTSIGSNQNANVDLTIPKTVNFVHKCYINIAREIWKNPYLYNENINGTDYQQNMRTIELIIKENIENTIRRLLPIKEILKQHLETYESNNIELQKKKMSIDIKELLLHELRELRLLDKDTDKGNNIDYEINTDDEDEDKDGDEEQEKEEQVKEEQVKEEQVKEEQVKEEQVKVEQVNKIANINESVTKVDPIGEHLNYDSPDEETIQKNCENIEINNIPDITTDYHVQSIKEEKYDNIDITATNIKDNKSELLNTFIQNLPTKDPKKDPKKDPFVVTKDPFVVTKDPFVVTKDPFVVTKDPKKDPFVVVSGEINSLMQIPEDKEVKITKENKKPVLREVISVNKVDNSDNETVDDFFNDVTKLLEEKGEKINRNAVKYTLFDDADENE